VKAKMIPPEQVEALVGHAPGGVCPLGRKEGVPVYLDQSLRRYDVVYPAAGDDHTAVRLTLEELEALTRPVGWVDVTKPPEA
ncbi:MAG: YbaK/EbsC family protein, partial [Clostridia bacterium]|nr:YbaK/EbsC family protein [Clostridia bacterium]